MTSITVHDLDDTLSTLIRARARAEGKSLNQTIKRLLEEALGVRTTRQTHRKDFEKFCGMWSREQAAAFRKSISDLERADAEDWK